MIIEYRSNEKRKITRTEMMVMVSCRISDPDFPFREEFDAVTLDLNEIGVTLMSERIALPGLKITVKFYISDFNTKDFNRLSREIVFQGTVLHVSKMSHDLRRLGVSFDLEDEETEAKFFDILCSHTSTPHKFNKLKY